MKTTRFSVKNYFWSLALLAFMAALASAEEQNTRVLSDPTRPFGAALVATKVAAPSAPLAPRYVLQAIIRRGEQRKALINGQWVEKNQTISGAKISQIDDNSVTLQVLGRIRQLHLQPAIIRREEKSVGHIL